MKSFILNDQYPPKQTTKKKRMNKCNKSSTRNVQKKQILIFLSVFFSSKEHFLSHNAYDMVEQRKQIEYGIIRHTH